MEVVTGEPMSYTNWSPGEPNNADAENSFCILSERVVGRFGLNDVSDTSTVRATLWNSRLRSTPEVAPAPPVWSGGGHEGNFFDLAGTNHAGTSTEVRFASGKVGLAGDFNAEFSHRARLAEAPGSAPTT